MLHSLEQVSIYLQFDGLSGDTEDGAGVDGVVFRTTDPPIALPYIHAKQEIIIALDAVVAQMREGQRLSIEITGRNA